MYELTKELQTKLSTVLMEYLNVNDWKGLFVQTDCEEFAQQHTQFYEDASWENETLDKDCAEALAFILNKDSAHLKAIWEIPGVQAMSKRKDEGFHTEIQTLIEDADKQLTSTNLPDENQNPYKTLEDAEDLLDSERTRDAAALTHAALRNFLQQTCTNNEISTDKNDSVSILHAKVNDFIKRQGDISLNNTSLSVLRTATLLTETIDDLNYLNRNKSHFNKTDMKYAINVTRSTMIYIDELITHS